MLEKCSEIAFTLSNFIHIDDICTDEICGQTNGQLDAFP